ncbi:MAG: phenylalanine--tRNA ligase subunit alpha [Candidatus Ancillula sp.]|jgi:phenylalanyl-tRNA synthetase alpha chain|nr:phenylalanine--tRNA ligase subunit alpha [Candidatus Ancillula sp.]
MFDAEKIQKDVEDFTKKAKETTSLIELDNIRKVLFGDKGIITLASKMIGKLAPEERAGAGKVLSSVRATFNPVFEEVKEKLESVELKKQIASEKVDVTVESGDSSVASLSERLNSTLGARHPIQVLQEDVANFFQSIGWQIASGPEVEAEWYNFDALNFGPDHPARQMQDTFYGEQLNTVLRTHTSPVQARSLIDCGVPLYIACPGKVFRTDELDSTHTPVFHQCEGLAIDKGLTMANLKGTLDAFFKAMFGDSAKARLRPSYFPFTEPSAEMDVWFEHKKGGAGWIELGGCGMVHPNVLRSCGIDPEVYSGFAFGMGLERTLMLRHDIQDMHDIVEGDIRFSKQYGLES